MTAARAAVRDGQLQLSGLQANVFAFEPDAEPPLGVSESAERFLTRWSSINHSLHPAAFLMSHAVRHAAAYRTLSLQIDRPRRSAAGDWTFAVAATPGREQDYPGAALELADVTVTIVMAHSPDEFALGHVCGPWDAATLPGQQQLAAH